MDLGRRFVDKAKEIASNRFQQTKIGLRFRISIYRKLVSLPAFSFHFSITLQRDYPIGNGHMHLYLLHTRNSSSFSIDFLAPELRRELTGQGIIN